MSLGISCSQTFSFCYSNVTAFPTSWKCKNFNFSLYTVPAEMLYFQRYLTNFQNLFSLKGEEGGYCGLKFQVHRHFGFRIATLQLFQHPENFKISIFPFTLSWQKCYISRSIWRIFKNFFSAERRGMCLLWLKISSAQTFSFCLSIVTTFPTPWKCKNFIFCLYTGSAEMLYLQKYLTNFQKHFSAERRERWLLSLRISSAQTFSFPSGNVTIFPTSGI